MAISLLKWMFFVWYKNVACLLVLKLWLQTKQLVVHTEGSVFVVPLKQL